MESQIQLGMAYEQFQKGKNEQLNESINTALAQYQSKLLNETNWSAPEELKTLMSAIESNEKKIIEQAKSELEIGDENDENEKKRAELIIRWFIATCHKGACNQALALLNEENDEFEGNGCFLLII